MKKGYWVGAYREILNSQKLAAYAKLAAPAVIQAGGKFLCRGTPSETFEQGIDERTVVVEFESVEAALNARETPAYKEALEALGDGAIRDFRVVEGTE